MSLINRVLLLLKKESLKSNAGTIKGRKYEAKIVNYLKKKKIKVIEKNKIIYDSDGKRVTDIDIVTEHANIEVKTGKQKTNLGKQLRKYDQYDKYREPIGMAPNISNVERKRLNEEGFNVFAHKKKMVNYLREKNKNPTYKIIIEDYKKCKKRKKNKKRKKKYDKLNNTK